MSQISIFSLLCTLHLDLNLNLFVRLPPGPTAEILEVFRVFGDTKGTACGLSWLEVRLCRENLP